MSDQDERGTTRRVDTFEGGTSTPVSGRPSGTGQEDPVARDQEEDKQDGGQAGRHGQLSGSNPDAPGYGSASDAPDA